MVCADNWFSPSIGRPGACSWHGGVSLLSGLSQYIVIPLSLVVAFAAVPQIFDVGAHVYHPRFGHGKITGLEGDGYETKVIISFGAKPEEFHLGAAINSGLRVTTN
jgi:hypothetical protein